MPGNSQSPGVSHPHQPELGAFGAEQLFPGGGAGLTPQHADNERHLPHWCFPGRGVGKRETERETNSSVHLSVHGSSALGDPRGAQPKLGPSLLCPSLHSRGTELVLGTVTQASTSPLPQLLPGRTFPLLGKPRGLVEGRNSSKHFTLFIFPPAGHDASGQHLWLPAVSCPC